LPYAEGIQEFVERCDAAMPPDFHTRPLQIQRELYQGLTDIFPFTRPDGISVRDEHLLHDGRRLRMRIYRPRETAGDGAVVYIRGGGFVVGSLATHDTVVAELAHRTGLVAIALDFRMAPEHPFPCAVEDCYQLFGAIVEMAGQLGLDRRRIVIAGDSSGANMAVVVSLMLRDRGGPMPAGQALISPVLDFTRWRHGGEDSPLLTGSEMEYYVRCYAPEPGNVADRYVSPLVDGELDGLPPAYVMGAEMDPLRVDAVQYAERLRAEGTPVELAIEPGLVHSAVRARGLSPAVQQAWERYCAGAARLAGVTA
jgi:acetyl esterase